MSYNEYFKEMQRVLLEALTEFLTQPQSQSYIPGGGLWLSSQTVQKRRRYKIEENNMWMPYSYLRHRSNIMRMGQMKIYSWYFVPLKTLEILMIQKRVVTLESSRLEFELRFYHRLAV